jgi:RHS repeat-associated protein
MALTESCSPNVGTDYQESYDYDSLDRLSTVTQTITAGASSNGVTLSLLYDQLGNITSKSGLGGYAYKSATGLTGCSTVAGPHAVSQVNGKNYCYDANGNNTTVRKNGSVIRTIVYTGFDLAESINRNESTSAGQVTAQVSFKYGTDRAMYKRVDGTSAQLQTCRDQGFADRIFCSGLEDSDTLPPTQTVSGTTTYYVGNVEFINTSNVLSVKRYIGNYLVITKVGTNAVTYDYLLRDALGSIDTIASETGVLKSRQSFNAHGERRQVAASGWSLLDPVQAANFLTTTTTQGYTGHQQLDAVGLVHMGARLYDAEIGRFIQADDYVEPEATQGLNRYSYVLNNPMSATDPSGNFSLRQAIGTVVGIVAAIYGGVLFAAGKLLASFAVAVAGGFTSAAIATGSLKAGLWGAVSAAAFWGVGTYFSAKVTVKIGPSEVVHRVASGTTLAKVAAHAITGGTLTQLQGGKFGHGFVAAGFTEALSPAVGQIEGDGFGAVLSRTAVSAAIGGTVSKLSGGSFANGAQTGAFQQLFNETVHQTYGAWPGDKEYDPNDPTYHSFTEANMICGASDPNCGTGIVSALVYFEQNAPSFQLEPTPVQAGKRELFAPSGASVMMGTADFSNASSYTDGGNYIHQQILGLNPAIVTNRTISGWHIFAPGQITRVVVKTNAGVFIVTHGVGTNNFSGITRFDSYLGNQNKTYGPQIFRTMDALVRNRYQAIGSSSK